jgi:hypothetical protein
MLHSIASRLAISAVLGAAILPATVFAQSQDSQSVAEASRRARAQKKNAEKPPKVITDDTLVVKKDDVQSATAEQPKIAGSPETPAQPAAGAATAQGGASAGASANPPASKNVSEEEKSRGLLKQRVALKEKIKDAQSDLDLLQREYQLDQDSYYSTSNYANDTAGKEKLDAMKQQIASKQQELERLKAELAALPPAQESPANTPPKP